MRKFHIECTHGTSSNPVDDHYPLTRDEVAELLAQAVEIRQQGGQYWVNEVSSIQVRLDQGIPGLQCPRAINGTVAKKESQLDSAYVKWMETRPTSVDDAVVDYLYGLMQ